MFGRWLIGGLAAAMLFGSQQLLAQIQRPLAPLPPGGLRVAPFLDGWYQNPDGSTSFSFGYSNLNLNDTIEIPVGPDNFITPAEYNGKQPTVFYRSGTGREGGNARDRERGVFTVTVPPGFKGEVVWTIRHAGQTNSVPGHTRATAYMLRWPAAMGSTPPLLSFSPEGPTGRGPMGIEAPGAVQATVGTPVTLTVHLVDDAVRVPEPLGVKRREDANVMNVTWQKFSGPIPGYVIFDPETDGVKETKGTASTQATFHQPGQYVVRVRADVFGRLDTSAGNQCCWTNGYIRVNVTR